MPLPIKPVTRRELLKLFSLGGGAWILTACSQPLQETLIPVSETPRATNTPTALPATHVPASTNTPIPTELPDIKGLGSLPDDFKAGRITSTEDFYIQNSNGVAKPNPLTWRLSLNGLFENPFELSMTDILRRPSIEVMRTLECIGNPVGGNLIGNATWKGVSLRGLLEEAGLLPEAKYLQFYSADEYETSVPVSLGLEEGSLLVYEMNNEPLTTAHGHPIRLLLPGVYGQKQPKWIIAIHASERSRQGTWEKKGWSNDATIQINSKIETPRLRQTIPAGFSFYITGIAMADTSGVKTVELSTNDGENWHKATLSPGSDSGVWTLWHWAWENPEPGRYVLLARATDGNGVIQMASGTFGVLDNVFPNGTSLMHRISVSVT